MNPFPPPNGSMPPFPPFPNMPFPPPGFPNMPFPPPGFPRPPNAPGFPNLPPWNTSGIPMQNTIVKPPVVNPLQHSTHQITTVYVGKIAAGIEDEFVRKLLEQCGRIANWRRMSDPVSGKLKGFGFCDFESPQGAITSLNCLNGLTLGDQALLIKVDEKTQKLLDEYVLKKEQAKKLLPPSTNDNTPKTLDEIFGDYVRVKNVISQLIEVRERGGNYRIISVDSELNRFNKPADSVQNNSEIVEKPRERPKPKQEDEKPEERDKAELEREARRKEREERDYLQREEEWELREKNKMRDRAREHERLAYEKDRSRRDLVEYDDSERKRRTREYLRRKRERERELQEDEADRAREIQEEEFKRREEQRRLEELEREREKELERQKELEQERENARLQSMMDAAMMEASPSPAWSPGADENNSDLHRSQSGEFSVSSPSGITGLGKIQVQLASSNADKKKQKPVVPIVPGFDEEPEDTDPQAKRKRKLEVLESALHTDKKNRSAKLELAKSLIEKIPTEKEQLFAYEMDWNTIQQHNIMETKMRPWVSKKIVEYLGEEEKSLIDFILSKISAKMPPTEILGYIQPVLDEEADSFLVKLWRMLIFEMLSAAAVPK